MILDLCIEDEDDHDECAANLSDFVIVLVLLFVLTAFFGWISVQAFDAVHAAGNFSYANPVFLILQNDLSSGN